MILSVSAILSSMSNVTSEVGDMIRDGMSIIDQIHNQFPLSSKVNSCLLTKYPDGSSICPAHGDDEPFIGPSSDIFTLSVGAERSMKFLNSMNNAANPLDENVR